MREYVLLAQEMGDFRSYDYLCVSGSTHSRTARHGIGLCKIVRATMMREYVLLAQEMGDFRSYDYLCVSVSTHSSTARHGIGLCKSVRATMMREYVLLAQEMGDLRSYDYLCPSVNHFVSVGVRAGEWALIGMHIYLDRSSPVKSSRASWRQPADLGQPFTRFT